MTARHRLRGRGRFAAVRTGGFRATAGVVRITVVANGGDVARVGFAISGLRSAVTRNLIRRRLRDAVRPLLPTLAGLDVVIATGAGAASRSFSALREDVVTAATRAARPPEGSGERPTADNAVMTTVVAPT